MQHTKRLLEIMALLRDPQKGCPWDVEQDFASIAPYTLEEAYEVADAIAQGDMGALKEELGDLLLQVAFHSQMAREEGLFDFEDVAESICDKMVARHPHVFGAAEIKTAQAQIENWEKLKTAERKSKQAESLLDGVPLALPALTRAEKLGKRASRAGFDWPDIAPVFAKLEEELGELKEAVNASAPSRARSASASLPLESQGGGGNNDNPVREELGDLLFACVNLARHLKLDPEEALRRASRKFERRFRYIELALAARGKTPENSTPEEMETLWEEAKRARNC